ncbi:MAG: ATP-binding protein [Actinomycetota bacterium]|nr:ATP-binding protein [Actinomycetota bacterium]
MTTVQARPEAPPAPDGSSQPRAERRSGRDPAARQSSIVRPVAVFLLAGLAAAAVITGAGITVQRRLATDNAVKDAKRLTAVVGRDVAGPQLSDEALSGSGPAQQALDRFVHDHVLSTSIIRVKVWDPSGRILYSDDSRLVGQQFPLGEDEQGAIRSGQVIAEVSNLQAPENADERQFGKLLEVYLGMRTTSGQPVLFETYQRYDVISAYGQQTLRAFAPALLVGLALLYVVQIPLAVSLARRLRAGERRQVDLLRQTLAASDTERRRIAADLHDGVVQGLAGASYSLSAAGTKVAAAGLSSEAAVISQTATGLRQWVRELRTLVLNIAPPKLHEEGLAAALADLTSTVRAGGVEVTADVDPQVRLRAEDEALLFRVAQEAVRNVIKHAHAGHVHVSLHRDDRRIQLVVADDGVGFDQSTRARRRGEGHLGLELAAELAEQTGCLLQLSSEPGAGTMLTLEIPLR